MLQQHENQIIHLIMSKETVFADDSINSLRRMMLIVLDLL